MEKNASFDLAFYRPLSGNITKYSELNLIVVDNFLPLWRQFSAVFEQNPTKLSFMRALQGLTQEEPSSENTSNLSAITEDAALDDLLFVDAEMCLGLLEDESESKLDKDYTPLIRDDVSSMHDLCSLNETQKIAVNSFVESVPASITIVQG